MASGKKKKDAYPAVLLGVPLGAEGVEGLAPLGAVGELEEAGEGAPVLCRVEEDGILEVDAVGEDVVVLVHPGGKKREKQRLYAAIATVCFECCFSLGCNITGTLCDITKC